MQSTDEVCGGGCQYLISDRMEMIESTQPEAKVQKLKDLCRTHWNQRINALNRFQVLHPSILCSAWNQFLMKGLDCVRQILTCSVISGEQRRSTLYLQFPSCCVHWSLSHPKISQLQDSNSAKHNGDIKPEDIIVSI